MPLAKELVVGYVSSTSGTGQNALTAGVGQSFTIRNFSTGNAYLQEVVGQDSVGAFTMQIKSPKLHDTTYGLQFASTPKSLAGTSIFNPVNLLPSFASQTLYATDTLTWTAADAGTQAFCGTLDIYYTDLSGIAARLYSWEQIHPLIVNLAGVQVSPVTNGTAGLIGTSALLNSGQYNLKANTDYAILGWQLEQPTTAVMMRGTDTGNLWVGGPGSWDAKTNGAYFVDQSVRYASQGRAAQIPVFNSNNAGGFEVNLASTATTQTIITTLTVAQLSQLLPSPGAGI